MKSTEYILAVLQAAFENNYSPKCHLWENVVNLEHIG